jgi:hypothetical protein
MSCIFAHVSSLAPMRARKRAASLARRSGAYAPRLRRERRRELELVEDARAHRWQRELERYQSTVKRIEELLADLGEPLDGPEATD